MMIRIKHLTRGSAVGGSQRRGVRNRMNNGSGVRSIAIKFLLPSFFPKIDPYFIIMMQLHSILSLTHTQNWLIIRNRATTRCHNCRNESQMLIIIQHFLGFVSSTGDNLHVYHLFQETDPPPLLNLCSEWSDLNRVGSWERSSLVTVELKEEEEDSRERMRRGRKQNTADCSRIRRNEGRFRLKTMTNKKTMRRIFRPFQKIQSAIAAPSRQRKVSIKLETEWLTDAASESSFSFSSFQHNHLKKKKKSSSSWFRWFVCWL